MHLLIQLLGIVKRRWSFFQIFVAFSEYLKFILRDKQYWYCKHSPKSLWNLMQWRRQWLLLFQMEATTAYLLSARNDWRMKLLPAGLPAHRPRLPLACPTGPLAHLPASQALPAWPPWQLNVGLLICLNSTAALVLGYRQGPACLVGTFFT